MKNENYRLATPLHVQSNGGGIQSFTMYLMSCMGILPRFDYSIFIDLGHEKKGTYKAMEFLRNYSAENKGIPIITVSDRNLMDSVTYASFNRDKPFFSIPFFSSGLDGKVGMLKRQCTPNFKIRQVNSTIKKLYGLSGNQRYPETYVYIGISLDEADRVSTPEPVKFTNVYPFILYQTGYKRGNCAFRDPKHLTTRMTRNDCKKWLTANGFPIPPKSSCVFCPYTSNADWRQLKKEEPESFHTATTFDDFIRYAKPGKVNSKLYLHKSQTPLKDVDFSKDDGDSFFECEGYCHT